MSDKKTNCPNCGAPFDPEKWVCAYCGTPFLDFSAMNLSDGKPIFLKIKYKDPLSGKLLLVTQKAISKLESVDFENEEIMYGGLGFGYKESFSRTMSVQTKLSFNAVWDQENHTIMKLEMADDDDV